MQHPHLAGFDEWRLLGRGELADIWVARQLSLNRLVAVKVYPTDSAEGDARFLREAAAAGRLSDHPGIVTAHDAGLLPDDRPYLVMKLCPGGSLASWLERENRPTPEEVRQVGVRLAAALAAVHACGVLHRDIRPANVLIDSFGHPGLANFEMAAVTGAEQAAAGGRPVVSAFAPPEALTEQPATESGDVFSLGATLYALLTGGAPPTGAAPGVRDRMAGRTGPLRPLPGVERNLMDAVLAALSTDPAARPTADRLRDQLANGPAAGPFGPEAERDRHPVASAGAPRREGRGRERVLALAVSLAAVTASLAGWMLNEPASSDVADPVAQTAAAGGPTPSRDPAPGARTSAAGDTSGSGPTEQDRLQLQGPPGTAKPFQTVRLSGIYQGGADTLLRLQRWEEGDWLAFPMPTKTDQEGRFTAYVELGQPGRYRLRVLDPDSGVTSDPSVLVIKG